MVPTNCNANREIANDASSVKVALVSVVTAITSTDPVCDSACETDRTRTPASFRLVSRFLAATDRTGAGISDERLNEHSVEPQIGGLAE